MYNNTQNISEYKKKKVGLPELTKKIETISLKLISEGVTNEVDFATIGL